MIRVLQTSALTLCCSIGALAAPENTDSNDQIIEQVVVQGLKTANEQPVGTYGTAVSNLEYDPRVDVQSRNMAEAQADVSIRGGIFENTGFRIGNTTLLDPQTGHYAAEIPVAPEMLSEPQVLTGAENALYGVNSAVGTVSYAWTPIRTGGEVSLGAGNNDLNLQRLRGGVSLPVAGSPDWSVGLEADYSRSESDGSIDNGDHDYQRAAARIQLTGPHSQTDLFYGYQDKFFGWPNLYTPFNVNETEDIQTRLAILNHRQTYAQDSAFEVSAYHRSNKDHYVFSREAPTRFQAFHETTVTSVALSGRHAFTEAVAINYSAQLAEDDIESTTLENNFTSRRYTKFGVLPEYQLDLQQGQQVLLRLGAAFDDTNRDDSELSLIGDISWLSTYADGSSRKIYLSYAEASQVAGYTAIGGSETAGLFRSNHQLQRENSKNLELGLSLDKNSWTLDVAIFQRQDDDLTDWTYSFSATSARSANPVDIDTLGFELLTSKRLANLNIVASYTYLNKSEDYGDTAIDASFYALNYPDHRVTLGAVWQALEQLEIRIDNEWRTQEENLLRNGDDDALFTHITATYSPAFVQGLEIALAVDNLWGEKFEEIPGTPGRGEQYSIGASYRW